MHDFGKFCYLDVPKTGSTFISQFLIRHSVLPEVDFSKHRRLNKPDKVERGKFFFISAREPFDQYKSLYFYGVNQSGALFSNASRKEDELSRFYDGTTEGFSNWLRYVLDPRNFALFTTRPGEDGKLFGPMTHRFLSLSFFRPRRVLNQVTDFDSLVEIYQQNKLHSDIVKNESLNEDMATLVDGPLRAFIKDPDAAIEELRSTDEKPNASARTDKRVSFAIDPELIAHLRERERFLYEMVGYDQQAA